MTKVLFSSSTRFDDAGKTGCTVTLEGTTETKQQAFEYAVDKLQEQIPERKLDLDTLAERFCATPLPTTVCADACATIPGYAHHRSGTNLLTIAEARQMLSAVLFPAKEIPHG